MPNVSYQNCPCSAVYVESWICGGALSHEHVLGVWKPKKTTLLLEAMGVLKANKQLPAEHCRLTLSTAGRQGQHICGGGCSVGSWAEMQQPGTTQPQHFCPESVEHEGYMEICSVPLSLSLCKFFPQTFFHLLVTVL